MSLLWLAIPAAVVAWFVFVVSLGTGICRHDMGRAADDRRMIRHLAKNYPTDTESGNTT